MIVKDDEQTSKLLTRVAEDDSDAIAELLGLYRGRVRKMIAIRLDQRLASRLDPSDVIQETFLEAVHRLPDFARQRPIEFLPWLRSIAMNRLTDQYRRHIGAQRRSVLREELPLPINDESQVLLAERFAGIGHESTSMKNKHERTLRVRAAIQRLVPADREVLVLKYLEELSAPEIAAILGVGLRTVWRRHTRAIETLGRELEVNDE